jgi:acyl-CoA synthetase (AMP-forming)/AMP-acid ligase II
LNVRNSVLENIDVIKMFDVQVLIFDSSIEEHIASIKESCPSVKVVICFDRATSKYGPSLSDLIAGFPEQAPDIQRKPDDVTILAATSGTTGHPKGLMLTHLNFESMVAGFGIVMPHDEPPVNLVVAPLSHAAGFLALSTLPYGGTQLLIPKPDPGLIAEWIEKYRVTLLFLPPTLIYMMLAHPDVKKYDYSSLRYIIYGAAPMSVEKLREAISVFGPVLHQQYAQMEVPMVITVLTRADHMEALSSPDKQHRLLSCGRPGPFVRIGVMDDDGHFLPVGQPGEIVLRSLLVMKGYYKNPAATEEVSTFGWHHTGDVGRMDEDGFVYLVDRKKDMIISGGFNVYPAEVEQVLWSHPAVQDCAVIGIPDEKWGEAVTAVVELKPGLSVGTEELILLCKQRVGSVKAPKTVQFWPELPRSGTGKVLKREIRKVFWEGQDRMIG